MSSINKYVVITGGRTEYGVANQSLWGFILESYKCFRTKQRWVPNKVSAITNYTFKMVDLGVMQIFPQF